MAQRRDVVGEARRFLHARDVEPDAGILVAISGGRDSVALGHAFSLLAKERPWRWELAIVDHGLRPNETPAEVALARAHAERWEVPLHVLELAPPPRFEGGVLAWARTERYRALTALREERGLGFLATAHHQDDQAEGMLIRLIRGAAPGSFAGMRGQRDRHLRPLLGLGRSDLDAFVAKHRLAYVDDPSNLDQSRLRARIRAELLPLFDRVAGHRIAPHLAALARDLEEDETFLLETARKLWHDAAGAVSPRGWEVAWLRRHAPALRRRMVRQGLISLGIAEERLTRDHIDAVLHLGEGVGTVELPGGHRAWRSGAVIAFE